MKIAILCAMDKELELLLKSMPEQMQTEIGGNKYYCGKIAGHEIVAGKCGIGKVNAALNTLRMIRSVEPDLVINSGVAGGVDGTLNIGSLLVADKVAYHDVWCGPGTVTGQADGFPLFFIPDAAVTSNARRIFDESDDVNFGLICSGDRFISKPEEVERIKNDFPEALAVDMESAAIAQTCVAEGVPFAIVRVMSDTPGRGENVGQYQNFWQEAPRKTFESVIKIIRTL